MSEATIVWVVEGSCGEYSDHSEWPVAAYTTVAEAERHVEMATKLGNETRAASGDTVPRNAGTALDKDFTWDYSGFSYSYYGIPVLQRVEDYPNSEAVFTGVFRRSDLIEEMEGRLDAAEAALRDAHDSCCCCVCDWMSRHREAIERATGGRWSR